jgi:hypothetical protein
MSTCHFVPVQLRMYTQALRWSTQQQSSSKLDKATEGDSQQPARQINITLPDASYEPAATAILAGLYQIWPWSRLIADLNPQQQVQAAVLADMWQLPVARGPAAKLLEVAADSADKAAAVLESLISMAVLPDCLLPVFEKALLCKHGDLEAVWAPTAAALQESLLALPLHAMELLLASSKLKVGGFAWSYSNGVFVVPQKGCSCRDADNFKYQARLAPSGVGRLPGCHISHSVPHY